MTFQAPSLTNERVAQHPLGDMFAAAVLMAGVVALLAVPVVRRFVWRGLRAGRVRRAWERAAVDAGLGLLPWRCPRVVSVARVPAGDLLRVRVRRGGSVSAIEARGEELAACLRIREIRVVRERADAADARVLLVRRDPLEDAAPLPWPRPNADELSLWEPVPVGVDEQGEAVAMRLVERNVLIGGEPGAGKSAALSMLVAAAALDPTRGCGCWTASWSSWRRGRRWLSGSLARMVSRRSSCCAISGGRWTSATASCCARLRKVRREDGCRCTWWSATSWRSI